MEETVDLYAQGEVPGRVVGTAPRRRMRARNLPHAAVKILVRDVQGQVYVHRRTETKDLFPGLDDPWIGGVITAGEEPDSAAVRELAEELGLRDQALRPLSRQWYTDTHTNFLAYTYETVYEPGLHEPIVHQQAEVADGWWLPWDELTSRLARCGSRFAPDGRELLTRHVTARRLRP
ncbi:NUDIX domain-containing protein [Streptomyces sp. NBC_00988]|uniref:NUDIX domain-containing protein n=1 Tax=Streptomyces sp. NBC_00988 TaxID=2903704 RepID=UPI00386BFCFF|nr:NUDIX domain-containing protein [Streptomyces sp. NBC_00988]